MKIIIIIITQLFDFPAGAPVINYDARIILGEQATRGQFPHQAAIFIDDVHFCGGALISDSWVLTAGHCVDGCVYYFFEGTTY